MSITFHQNHNHHSRLSFADLVHVCISYLNFTDYPYGSKGIYPDSHATDIPINPSLHSIKRTITISCPAKYWCYEILFNYAVAVPYSRLGRRPPRQYGCHRFNQVFYSFKSYSNWEISLTNLSILQSQCGHVVGPSICHMKSVIQVTSFWLIMPWSMVLKPRSACVNAWHRPPYRSSCQTL